MEEHGLFCLSSYDFGMLWLCLTSRLLVFVKRFCSVTVQHIPTNPSGETAKEIIVVETLPPESVFDVLDRHVPRGNPCSP